MRSNTVQTKSRCMPTRSLPVKKVVLVDDLVATGGTAEAAVKLLRGLGAEIVAALPSSSTYRNSGAPSACAPWMSRCARLISL